jgi:hypothetical protein
MTSSRRPAAKELNLIDPPRDRDLSGATVVKLQRLSACGDQQLIGVSVVHCKQATCRSHSSFLEVQHPAELS